MALKIIPGIIGNVISNLFKRPGTISYPKVRTQVPPGFRGKIWVNDKCISCGACARACPAMAISVEKTKISVWTLRCINCGRCVDVCPVKAINFSEEYEIVSDKRDMFTVQNYVMANCTKCGKSFMNLKQIQYMAEKTKQPIENFMVCHECRKVCNVEKIDFVAAHTPEVK